MLSLVTAVVVSSFMHEGRIKALIEEILILNGEKLIQASQTSASSDLIPFMHNLSGLSGNLIQLYNKEHIPLLGGNTISIDAAEIDRVLAGRRVRDIGAKNDRQGYMPHYPVAGLPFHAGGESYALFITVEKNPIEEEIMNSIHLTYIIILFIGSLLIIVTARYIINPIVRLTEATRLMAKGKFDVELQTKRKDEIGVLSVCFTEMAQELAKLEQMRRDFVSNVSHEIQSPLTSISGFSKALRQKTMSEESRIRYLTIIEQESDRLSRLSQNLLSLSYLQQGLQLIHPKEYRIDKQIREVVIALEPQWAAKEIKVDVQLEAVTLQADEDQLKQVWINLLHNSIKFTPERGTIQIQLASNKQLATVTITDTGIGIPEEERADIFKPFHKVDKARDSKVKGNGLGLSIVKNILDLHNGTIQVSGTYGIGSTFTVILPL